MADRASRREMELLSNEKNMSSGERSGKTIVVIGAGLAGLTAASKLAEAYGTRVLLLEREKFTGGMAHTFSEGDISYDYGSHRIHPAFCPDGLGLIRELLGEELMLRERRGKLRLGGKYMHYPPDLVDFLRGLGMSATLRGGASFLATRLFSPRDDGLTPSYETCMTRRTGKVIYDLFYSPYAWKVYGIDPRTISAHASKTRVSLKKPLTIARDLILPKKQEKKYFYYPYRGIGTIAEELQKRFVSSGGQLLTGVTLQSIRTQSGRVHEVVFRHSGGTISVPTDILIPTIPLKNLAGLFKPASPSAVTESARALKWRGIHFLYICLNRDFCCESETHYYPERRYVFGRMSEPKRFSPHMIRAEGKTILCVEVPCNVGDRFWEMGDDELLRHLLDDLRELDLIASEEEIHRIFSKWLPAVYPVYDLPWQDNYEIIYRFLNSIPNLYPIGRGSLFLHDNMDHAIRMGLEAADFIVSHHDKNDAWSEIAATFRHFGVRD